MPMKTIGSHLLLILLPFCLLLGCNSSSTDYSATIAEGRAAAREIMEATGASSISLAFVDGDRLVWAETFGLADKATNAAPAADTMYCIGSTSKMVATIAVMKLVDQGVLSLDTPLMNYIPSFSMLSPEYTQITIRMLLNHSAGFPGADYRNSESFSPLAFSLSAQVLETLKTQKLKHSPGYMSVYSNDGFTIAEQLVSAVTGKSYAQYVQDEIFVPLGMNNSRFPLEYFQDGSYAKRYAGDVPYPQLFLNSFGSGGLYSTPTEMAKIAMMLLGGGKLGNVRVLSEASVAAMGVDQTLSSFNPVKADSYSYGLGWDTVVQPGLGAVGVTGWQKGGAVTLYGSVMTVAPAEGLAVVVMGASNGFGPDSATIIAERVLLRALAENGWIAAMPLPLSLSSRPLKIPAQGQLEAVSGYYASNESFMRVHQQVDDSLNIDKYDAGANGWQEWKTGLKLRDDDLFSSEEQPYLSFSFKVADGKQYLIVRYVTGYGHYQDDIIQGHQVAATGVPAPWEARLGKQWLVTNEHPESGLWDFPLIRLRAVDDLLFADRGNLQVVNPLLSDSRTSMILSIPQIYGRDLDDFVVETSGGEEWVRFGSFVYRPVETIAALGQGTSEVSIGTEGLSEWRSIDAAGATRTITITPADARWKLYNGNFEQTERENTLSGGAFYLVFHDSANVRVE